MGDVGRGMFVRPGIPEFMRDRVVPAADVVTPNHFELGFLTGTTSTTLAGLLAAADALRARGPSVVLVTSTILDDTPDGPARPGRGVRGGRLADPDPAAADRAERRRRPHDRGLPGEPPRRLALDEVLARTTSSVFAVVEATADAGDRELHIVQAQDRLAEPRMEFEAERLR